MSENLEEGLNRECDIARDEQNGIKDSPTREKRRIAENYVVEIVDCFPFVAGTEGEKSNASLKE